MNKTYLRQLLLSRRGRLLITAEGLASMMTEAFPPVPETEAVPVQPTQNQGPESAAPQGERDENEDTDAE